MSNKPLQPGDRVGNYILREVIGEGAFAQFRKAARRERSALAAAVKIATETPTEPAPHYGSSAKRVGALQTGTPPHGFLRRSPTMRSLHKIVLRRCRRPAHARH